MKRYRIYIINEGNYFYGKDLDFKKYYNPKLLEAIAKGTEKVQVYFSEEFEIETNRNAVCHYMFPYLGKLIEMVIKSDGKAAPMMLKNTLQQTRILKSYGVEVWFTEDNIWTMNDENGELRLSIFEMS